MVLLPLEKVEKLQASDEIMFNLATKADKKVAILEVGKLLKEIGLLEADTNQEKIITTYQRSIQGRLQNYLHTNHKEKDEIVLNEEILSYYKNLDDEELAEIAQTGRKDFIKYSCIVLTFVEQINALKISEQGEAYRIAVNKLDHQRTQVHNSCLDDIKIIDRLTKIDKLQPFVSKSITDPNRTDYAAAIIKLCYYKVIEEMDAFRVSEDK